jgi:hypothetical protein
MPPVRLAMLAAIAAAMALALHTAPVRADPNMRASTPNMPRVDVWGATAAARAAAAEAVAAAVRDARNRSTNENMGDDRPGKRKAKDYFRRMEEERAAREMMRDLGID